MGDHEAWPSAWSVNTNPDGTVTFRMRNTSHPAQLQRVLGAAGVPAVVRWGEICLPPRPGDFLPLRGIVDGPRYVGGIHGPVWIGGQPYANEVWTITPSKLPKGTRYMISVIAPRLVHGNHMGMSWGLIRDDVHLTCKDVPPPYPPYPHGSR
jgi:hypothetical protein